MTFWDNPVPSSSPVIAFLQFSCVEHTLWYLMSHFSHSVFPTQQQPKPQAGRAEPSCQQSALLGMRWWVPALGSAESRVRLITPPHSSKKRVSMKAVQLNLLRDERAPDEIRHTHCLTWEQRAPFGKLLVKVSSKISTAHPLCCQRGCSSSSAALWNPCHGILSPGETLPFKICYKPETQLSVIKMCEELSRKHGLTSGCGSGTTEIGSGWFFAFSMELMPDKPIPWQPELCSDTNNSREEQTSPSPHLINAEQSH